MNIEATPLQDAYVIDLNAHRDERGFFARTFCRRRFSELGLENEMVQGNLSFNHKAGTVRGMHYQVAPAEEAKLVRCTRGSIFDVIIDLRPTSPTYMQHIGVELSAENRRSLYVPPMFAHGFQTLVDDTEVSYLVSGFHDPSAERGVRFDDTRFGITWPMPATVISPKDASWPSYVPRRP